MKTYLFCLLLILGLSCNSGSNQLVKNTSAKDNVLERNNKLTSFNQSFGSLIGAYLQLKDQLVAEKDSGIAQTARALILACDNLKLDQLAADSSLIQTAFSYSDGISSETQGLLGENNLLSKRRSFQMISDQLYELIKTVKYNQQILYLFYCKQAFEDQGAYWISNQTSINNPYQPLSKPVCGEIKDKIQFLAK
jgi:hypothetical protein